jgi:hypothetical protein
MCSASLTRQLYVGCLSDGLEEVLSNLLLLRGTRLNAVLYELVNRLGGVSRLGQSALYCGQTRRYHRRAKIS